MAKFIYKKQGEATAPAAAAPPTAGPAAGRRAAQPGGWQAAPSGASAGGALPGASPGRGGSGHAGPGSGQLRLLGLSAAARPNPGSRRGGAFGRALLLLAAWLLVAAILGGLFLLRATPAEAARPGGEQAAPGAYPPLEKHRPDERFTIVLDAGHGGDDPGAVAPYDESIWEKTITQAMAARVTALLERHPDELRVLAAAEPDSNATPLQRANTAIEAEADLFLSLHLNADYYPYYGRGFACFPSPPGRVYFQESAHFSRLLIERVRPTGLPVMGENGIFYHYYNQLPGGGFAKEIVDSADQAAPREDESFGVVEYAGCPAVLIEQWFISSAEDMALMNSEAGYDTMARCIYLAVCDYFEIAPIEEPLAE